MTWGPSDRSGSICVLHTHKAGIPFQTWLQICCTRPAVGSCRTSVIQTNAGNFAHCANVCLSEFELVFPRTCIGAGSLEGRRWLSTLASTTNCHAVRNLNVEMSAQASGSTLSEGTVPQAMSLHQQCMSLRARLLRIRGFQTYFSTLHGAGVGHESFDPVPDLQDLLCLGVSLCYLFDQLPDAFPKINNSEFDQIQYHENPDREKKRAIALFALQVRNPELIARIPGLEPFSISDLWDRSAPVDGFLKVSPPAI